MLVEHRQRARVAVDPHRPMHSLANATDWCCAQSRPRVGGVENLRVVQKPPPDKPRVATPNPPQAAYLADPMHHYAVPHTGQLCPIAQSTAKGVRRRATKWQSLGLAHKTHVPATKPPIKMAPYQCVGVRLQRLLHRRPATKPSAPCWLSDTTPPNLRHPRPTPEH